MRHRITYLKRPNVDFDPDAISITKNGITLHGLRASKEHRTTMGLDEVPQEVRDSLMLP